MTNSDSHRITELSNQQARSPKASDVESAVPSIALQSRSPFRWAFLLGALMLPFLIMACWIIATREWIVVDTIWDWLGIGISLVTGLSCVWQLPVSRLTRFVLALVYAPFMACLVVAFALDFARFVWI
jgi:hypothetical protein